MKPKSKRARRRAARRAQPWRAPAEVQNYPKIAGQLVQVRFMNDRCLIMRAREVNWNGIKEWRLCS